MAGKPTYEEMELWIRELDGDSARQRQTEQLLRKKEERYREVIESAAAAVLVAQKGRLVSVNPMVSAMTGYSQEELFAKPFVELIHPEDREMVLDRQLRRTKGEELPGNYQFRIVHKDGLVSWVEITTLLLNWVGEPATLNFLSDISARKESEEALEKRDGLLQSVTRMTRLLITEPDLDKAMKYALWELGEAVTADRVYVFRKHLDPSDGQMLMSQVWEWTSGNVSSEIGNPILQNLPYDALTPELLDNFKQKKAFAKSVEDLDPCSRGILEAQGIKSILQVPIYARGELWGLIGFDDCTIKRKWLDSETAILQIAADCLGGAVERLRTEEELKTSELEFRSLSKMLRLMCDNVPDMIWAKDLGKRFIFTNRAVCRGLLNAKDTDEPIGKTDMFFANRERKSHPEDPRWHTFGEICADSDQVVMDSRHPGRFDEFGNVKGRFLFLDVHKAPFLDETGEMVGTVGCARDVTAAREIAARYRLLTDKMHDVAWILDMNLNTTYVSPSIEIALGFTPEERMVQKLEEQVTPESLAIAGEVFRKEMEREERGDTDLNRSVILVMEYYHKDGSTRWFESVISGIRNDQGVLTGLHGVSRDITERKRKEEDECRQIARRQREASLVAKIAADSNLAEGVVNDLALQITEAASATIEVERVGVWLFDEKVSRLVNIDNYTASTGEHSSGAELLEQEFRNEFEAFRHAKYVDAGDAMTDPRTGGYVDGYLKHNRITSMLDAVIRFEGRNLGVICFEHVGKTRNWQEDEISFACQLADQLALAISNRERRRAEASLRESEQRYRYLVENTREAILVIQDGTVKFVNNKTVISFGYSEEELLSRPIFELIHPEDRDMVIRRYRQKIDGDEKSTRNAYRVIHKSDGIRWIEISSVLIEWHGRPATLNLITDITDRKQAEETLRQSEIFLRETQKIARLGGWKANPQTDYLEWTPGVYEILEAQMDYRPSLSEGLRFFLPEYVPLIRDNLAKCLETGEGFCIECEVTSASGKRLWTEVRGLTPVVEEERSYVFGTFQDITERKRTEVGLRESEERFRVLTERSPLGMALIGMAGRYEYLNPAFVRMFGYTLEDIPTGREWFRKAYPGPEYRKQVIQSWKDDLSVMAEGEGRQRTFIVNCRDGAQKTVLFRPVVHISGGQLLVCEDITESIRAEEEKGRLKVQLLQAQKMEAIGALAGGIAHDFNNILAAVIGYVELAQLGVEKSSRTGHYLNQIMKAGERARDLVKRILAFARRVEPGVKPIRVGLVAKEVVGLLRASLPSTIEIFKDVQTERDTILADPAQIHQVLMNLATNASHAMLEKGGRLDVVVDEEEVASQGFYPEIHPGHYVRLRVKDTGCGMTKEIMERIFDPYFTTKQPGVGTGLGLAVVNGIVREHKGAIRVDSSPGKGTTFKVLLPLIEDEVAFEMAEEEEFPKGEGTILLVDDEEMLVEMGKVMLEQLGYQVAGRTSSLEALEAFRASPQKFDLVITDMTMPHMTGDILAQELLRIRPDLPIIACTGFSERISDEKASQIGIKALVMKPLMVREIGKKVKEVLGSRRVK